VHQRTTRTPPQTAEALHQGMTSVVPQSAKKLTWTLQAAEKLIKLKFQRF
jgi:hypothetical protein